MPRVLHLLSQRPSLTGSGVTLDALVRHARAAGWQQQVVVGVPFSERHPEVGGVAAGQVLPLHFETAELPFPVPGMSDVMPYPSTCFSAMTTAQLDAYRAAWRRHLGAVIGAFEPDLIHAHHLWIVSSMLKDLAPSVPVLTQCHATGMRQMELCPHLAAEVRAGCSRNEHFAVLHQAHAGELCTALGIESSRVAVVGAGYREDLFHPDGRRRDLPPRLLFIGKLSAAKGLPQLLDAFELLARRSPQLELHVAGSGAGAEAEAIAARLRAMAPQLVYHGHVDQRRLGGLMRQASVCVLPSFYEGLPLVLVEALACGCRLVATALPGIAAELAPRLGDALEMVPMPAMEAIDRPRPEALPAFVEQLAERLWTSLHAPPITDPAAEYGSALAAFSWRAVFARVERVWQRLTAQARPIAPELRPR